MIRFKLDDEAQLFHTSKNSLENNTMFPIPQKPSNFSFGMGVVDLRFQPWYLMSEQVIWPVHSRDVVRPDPLRGTVSVPEAQRQLESGKHTQRGGWQVLLLPESFPKPFVHTNYYNHD